jgi:predicted DNA binding protein
MAIVDAHLRVHHPCPYCDISTEFPETLLLLWCDNRRDVFLVSAPTLGELQKVLRALRGSLRARPLLTDDRDAIVLLPEFEWKEPPSVTGLARRSRVWVLHPVVYHGGTETYRMIAPDRETLKDLVAKVRRWGDVELLSLSDRTGLESVRDLPNTLVHFFEGLTERQAGCLLAAYEGGLLDVPARSKWADVARSQGLSRSTFGEHLRKGQLRIFENSYSALRARFHARTPPEVLLSTRPVRRVRRTPLRGLPEGVGEGPPGGWKSPRDEARDLRATPGSD